ncbi:hypothetical protein H0H92_007107 [Tricholoma furcatifolium]|nr:hypothetical protein H0H92_007107 [Tricholoma furcatifolium]
MKKGQSKCCGVVEEAAQRTLQRRAARKQPQPWIVRKLMVGFTGAVMVYSVYVFVGRLCVDMIRRREGAGGSRATGIALLVVFSILWLWMVWAYIKVVITSPGHARDHVPKSDRPPYPEPASFLPYDHALEAPRYPPPSRISHDIDTDIESIGGPSYENIPIRPSLSTHTKSKSTSHGGGAHRAHAPHAPSPTPTKPRTANDLNSNGNGGTPGVPQKSEAVYPRISEPADYLRRRPPVAPILRPEHRYCQHDGIVKPSGLFAVFTVGMVFTHVRLIWSGLTTVESIQGTQMRQREERAMNEVIGYWAFGAKRRKVRSYDEEWGRIGLEGNIWWLGNGGEEWVSVMGTNVWGWFCWALCDWVYANMAWRGTAREQEGGLLFVWAFDCYLTLVCWSESLEVLVLQVLVAPTSVPVCHFAKPPAAPGGRWCCSSE